MKPSLVCSLSGGEVSANSLVARSKFATTAMQRLRILSDYRTVAMVGLSANPYRPSYFAAKYLLAEGYRIIPVHPRERTILGQRCYPALKAIPEPVEIVDIFRTAEHVLPLVEEAIEIRAKVVWLQLGVIHNEAAERARQAGLNIVMDHCMKIEHARFFGGLHTLGLNTGVVSSRHWSPAAGRKESE